MTDKEKLIKIKSLADEMYNAAFNLTTDASLLRKAMEEYHQFIIYKYYKEEPVSEDLEKAAEQDVCEVVNCCSVTGIPNDHIPSWVQDAMVNEFIHGAQWKENHLWKPADGDDLPEIDREVVAFQETFPTDVDAPSLFKIVIAHRPNPKGYDGKSVATGEVEHYTPETYDKGGWNIPNIKYWLDCSMPKEIEL